MSISLNAEIHPKAKIAENVTVDAFAIIQQNVEIGEGTWIGAGAMVMDGARIGKNCKIYPGAMISTVPQDLKYRGEETTAVIGDNTAVREYATVSKGTADKYTTKVGSNALIMSYVHVGHDCFLGNNCIVSGGSQIAGHVTIGDNAILGGMVAVHQFVKIGNHVMVAGGGTAVTKDIPHYVLTGRHPVSYKGINIVGLKRRGFSIETIQLLKNVYKYFYHGNHPVMEALKLVKKEVAQTKERDEILEFIELSTSKGRGIIGCKHEDAYLFSS